MAGKYSVRAENQASEQNGEELKLLRRIAARDRAALARLYVSYHARLFKFVFRLTGSYSIAEEMVNDVMLVVWRKADTFRGESRVSTWILGIAYRLAMRRLSRRQKRLARRADLDEASLQSADGVETEDWVQRGIASLPTAQQLTVMLVFYLGLSYQEVADVTDCPVNTVKTRMFHARRKLREVLVQASTAASVESEGHD